MNNSSIKRAELHGHTRFSEKDAIVKIPNLVKKAKDEGLTAIAVTEHGYLYSMVKFYQECQKQGIKSILGFEAYYVPDRELDRKSRYHLVLLAKNEIGLRNLYKLASDGGLNKIKGKTKDYPRICDDSIRKYGEGIIALSACIGGYIPQLILNGEYEKAKEKALWYKSQFDDFYLEVQPHDIKEQLIINEALIKMSQITNIPLVMTSDYHYLEPSEKVYHDILMGMGYRKPFTVNAHFRTTEEMSDYCVQHSIPLSAISNSSLIADSIDDINPKPKDPRGLMPSYPCPKGYTEDSYLRKIAMDALFDMINLKGIKNFQVYLEQIRYELDILCSMGFAGNSLILWDWFKWCRANKILLGKGRGQSGLLGM